MNKCGNTKRFSNLSRFFISNFVSFIYFHIHLFIFNFGRHGPPEDGTLRYDLCLLSKEQLQLRIIINGDSFAELIS